MTFDELLMHVGHEIICVAYGEAHHRSDKTKSTITEIHNVALECKTCNMELLCIEKTNSF